MTAGVTVDELDAVARAPRRPLHQRLALLRELAGALRARRAEYAGLITAEMGKPADEALAEIDKCVLACEHYADNAESYLAPQRIGTAEVRYEPLGTVLAVMPWNFPFWQFFRFAAPALAAGNSILLKHADNVPGCARAIDALLRAVDAPGRMLQCDVDQVAALIADDRVAAVTFTGFTRVGALIAAQAGAALKKQVLELGGSDPFLVLADADVPAAASAAAASRFLNAGQSCVNAKRFVVDDRVADEFVALLAGHARDRGIGPLARADLRATLHDQVRRTVAAGATLVLGGELPDGPGLHYPPTVLDQVTPGMAAFDEETFGPVATVTRARDTDHAVALANRSVYGLGAAVWTADPALADRVADSLEAGMVAINGMVASDPRLPFGGTKKSGYGRELGLPGLREFVTVKTVTGLPAPRSAVLRPSTITAHARGGGASTTPLVTKAVGADTFLNGITTFEPGAAIPLHTHNCAESVVVLEGTAVAEIDGVEHPLDTLDTTYVPAGIPHRFRNAAPDAPMRILWTYASVHATRTVVATGVTGRVDAEAAR